MSDSESESDRVVTTLERMSVLVESMYANAVAKRRRILPHLLFLNELWAMTTDAPLTLGLSRDEVLVLGMFRDYLLEPAPGRDTPLDTILTMTIKRNATKCRNCDAGEPENYCYSCERLIMRLREVLLHLETRDGHRYDHTMRKLALELPGLMPLRVSWHLNPAAPH